MKLFKKWMCVIILTLICQYSWAQQFKLPKVKYDKVKITKKDKSGKVGQKKYFQGKTEVLEVNYPINGRIKTYCGSTEAKEYDSTYFYSGEQIICITFSKKSIEFASWRKGGNIVSFKDYNKNGKLLRKSRQTSKLTILEPEVICSYWKLYVGESATYEPNGRVKSYYNYRTGKTFDPRTRNLVTDWRIQKMRKSAERTLRNAFGKRFFAQQIIANYHDTKFQWYSKERMSYRYRVPNRGRGVQWFNYSKDQKPFDCIDFAYMVKASEGAWYNNIVVRVDAAGKVIFKKVAGDNGVENTTYGLPKQSIGKLLGKEEALKLLKTAKTPFPLTGNYLVQLIWKATEQGSSKGDYYYKFLYDKFEKKDSKGFTVYYRQGLVNALNKEVSFLAEDEVSGMHEESMPATVNRKQGKYGFTKNRRVVIPFEYTQLPLYLNDCMIGRKENAYGCINDKNKVLIPFAFDNIYYLKPTKRRYKKNFLVVVKDNLKGLYDRTGKKLFDAKFANVTIDNKLERIVLEATNGKKEVYELVKK